MERATTEAKGPTKRDLRTTLIRYTPFGVMLGLAIALYLGNPMFLSPYNIQTILNLTAILLLISLGQTFVIMLGGIDLSVGAVASLVSVIFATLLPSLGYWAYVVAVLAGLAAGAANGIVFTRIRIPSFITTLGTMGVFLSLAYFVSGGAPVGVRPAAFRYLNLINGTTMGLKNAYWVALLVFLGFLVIQQYTRIGRYIFAVGAAERAAWISGTNVRVVKFFAMLLSGLAAGLAGILLVADLFSGTPTIGSPYQLQAIATVVVGGTALTGGVGGVGRTLVGALIMSMLSNGMNVVGINVYAQQIVTGLVIVGAVALTLDRSNLPVIK